MSELLVNEMNAEMCLENVVLEHSKVFSIVCLFLAFQPSLPFQVVRFLLAIPVAILVGFLSCLGFGRDGVREGEPPWPGRTIDTTMS